MSKIGQGIRESLGITPTQKKLAEGEDFETFGIQKVNKLYVLVKITVKDGQVSLVTKSQPDNRAVALERFKIETHKLLIGG